MSFFCVQSDAQFYEFRVKVHLLDLKQTFNSVFVLARSGRAFSATAVEIFPQGGLN